MFIGAHELVTALTEPRHAGRLRYWFGADALTPEWLKCRMGNAIEKAGPRYTREVHVEVSAVQAIDAACRSEAYVRGVAAGLGWTPERLRATDCGRSWDRDRPVERVGKKYQWIALYEAGPAELTSRGPTARGSRSKTLRPPWAAPKPSPCAAISSPVSQTRALRSSGRYWSATNSTAPTRSPTLAMSTGGSALAPRTSSRATR